MYLFEFSSFLDTCPGVSLLDHMVTLFLAFEITSIMFSIVALPNYLTGNSIRGFVAFSLHALNLFVQFLMMAILTGVFPSGTSGKEPACWYRRPKKCRFDPCVGKIPWRIAWQLSPVFLSGESHGQRGVAGYSP